MAKMRVLQLCKKFPYPIKDGESLAIHVLGKGLQQIGCSIDMLAMNTRRHPTQVQHPTPLSQHYQKVDAVAVDNRIKPIPALLNLFSSKSFHISRFDTIDYKNTLIQFLQKNKYDIILLETLYLCPYIATIRKWSKAKIVLRAHNVEHEIWERIVKNSPTGPKKWYVSHLTQKLKNYEITQIQKVDYLAAITERDWQHFQQLGYKGAGGAVPIGLDISQYHYKSDPSPTLSAGFIGSMDWMPNTTGLAWFIAQIWPSIQQEFPDLLFEIAGRNCPDSWLNRSNGKLKIIGEVADAQAFTLQHPIMIVPLLAGSGMRVKILEAMALGRVVISTSIGLEGIPAQHQKEVWVADDKEAFLAALRYLYQHPKQVEKIGKAARNFVENHFGYKPIASQFIHSIAHPLAPSHT